MSLSIHLAQAETTSKTNESQTTQQKDLKVLRVSPSGKEVDAKRQIVIQFNQAMVPLGEMAREAKALDVKVSPDPGCEWRWLNSSELSCRLSEKTQLAPATQYQVTVGTQLSSDTGQHLAKPFTQSFTTQLAKVEHAYFDTWVGAAEPVWVVTFNVPVTAQAVEQYVQFTGSWGRATVQASPYTQERQGPIILPVPNYPGAVVVIDNPEKESPMDVGKAHGEARKTWKVQPKAPLLDNPESEQGIPYDLVLNAGLKTPSGKLGGQSKIIKSNHIFGSFAFVGLECGTHTGDSIRLELVREGTKDGVTSYRTRLSPLRAKSVDHLEIKDCRPDGVRLVFNAPVPKKTLEQIEWKRETEDSSYQEKSDRFSDDTIKTVWSDAADNNKAYRWPFNLNPKERYTVTIPKGAEDVFGRPLRQAAQISFSTAHRAPFLSLPPSTGVLEKDEKTIMPYRFINLQNIDFAYDWITADSLQSNHVTVFSQKGNLLENFNFDDIQDKRINSDLNIRETLSGKSGFLWGDLKWYEGVAQEHQFNAQVTPWNILAKEGFYGTLVWLTELDTGKPVADAQIRLYQNKDLYKNPFKPVRDKHQQPVQVKTNKQGIAFLPKVWPQSQHTLYIAASRQQDMALLPLSWSFGRSIYQASQYDFWEEQEQEGGHMRAWSVTDQGIYKPGSPVNYAVFVRTEGQDQLEAPRQDIKDYRLTIEDPEGSYIVDKEKVDLSDFGDVSGQITIPEDAPMGWYEISLGGHFKGDYQKYNAGRFLVTDFVPANFKVRTQIKGTTFDLGDQLEAKVDAKLYAGGPYTQAKTTFKTRLKPKRFSPDNPALAGFHFGENDNLPDEQSIAEDDQVLNDQGEIENSLRLPKESKIIYGEVQVEGVVASARGKSVANTASAVFAARDRFIGLRTPNWLQQAGKAFKVEYAVADLKGQLQANEKINLALEYQEISRIREKNSDGDYIEKEDVEWIKIDQCEQQSASTPQACQFTPSKAGHYRIVGTVTDKKGRKQRSVLDTYVTGTEHTLWSHEDDVLTLVPEKSKYQVGDKARILVQNPYPGAKALVTIERYGVLWQEVVTLEHAASTIEVPIIKEAFPGAFLSVSVFSPRVSPVADPDLGKPVIAQGYMPLTVEGKGGTLQVDVNTNAKEYRPGDQVKVGIKVIDKNKKIPDKTRLIAVAVDQSVVDLLAEGEDYYDPRKTFYSSPDGPDIQNYSLVEQLLSSLEAKEGKGESPSAGGGDAGPKIRDQFNYSAFWNATLETDKKGEAKFDFELPDNLTQWQVIVIAMSQDDPMGVGMSAVQSNLPIQIEAALPNQIRVGDQFDAGFDIMNRTQEALEIESRIQAEGAIEKPKEALHQFALNSFEHELQWLSLKAEQPGEIKLLATAQSGELSDGLSKTVPVRYAGSQETAAEQGSLTQGKKEVALLVPAQAIEGTAQAEVIFSPTLLGGLEGAFNVMKEDAVQSWETRLSGAVLAANYLRLKDVLGEAVHWPEAEEVIAHQMSQAQKFQAQNGGMAFWTTRSDFVSPYLSVYTALAFTWLEEMGYEIPAQVKAQLNTYIQENVLDAKQKSEQMDSLRIAALTALLSFSEEEVKTSEVLGFMPKATELNLFSKALLLNATIALDDQKHADELLHILFSSAEESSGEISFNESHSDAYVTLLDTSLRSNCAILDAFSRYKKHFGDSDLLGETPSKLVQWISQQRQVDGSWPNSQENVFCTMAMTHYAEEYEAPIKKLGGTLQDANAKATQSVSFSSRQDQSELLSETKIEPGKKSMAQIGHEGEGRLYYNLRLKYVMPPEAIEAANAGMIVKRQYSVQRGEDWVAVDDATTLHRGDIIKVQLDVDTPTKRHHVILTDPLPGAFEAVNRDLVTSEQNLDSKEQDGRLIVLFDGGDWPSLDITEGGFYHREMAFDAVRFHADNLPAGQYRLVYSVQVIAPGKFVAPAAEIKQIYQPDVFGRDKPQHLNVSP